MTLFSTQFVWSVDRSFALRWCYATNKMYCVQSKLMHIIAEGQAKLLKGWPSFEILEWFRYYTQIHFHSIKVQIWTILMKFYQEWFELLLKNFLCTYSCLCSCLCQCLHSYKVYFKNPQSSKVQAQIFKWILLVIKTLEY